MYYCSILGHSVISVWVLVPPPHYGRLGASSIPFTAAVKEKGMRVQGAIYVLGHPLLKGRCPRLSTVQGPCLLRHAENGLSCVTEPPYSLRHSFLLFN